MFRRFKFLSRFLSNTKGVIAIEVGLTIGAYFLILFMIFEMGRIAISNAYWDLAVTESVRITKNKDLHDSNADYKKVFRDELEKNYQRYIGGSVMGLFATQIRDVKISVNYAYTMQNLLNAVDSKKETEGYTNRGQNAPIARYMVSYHYKFFIPLPFINNAIDGLFTRQFFVVQEYERPDF